MKAKLIVEVKTRDRILPQSNETIKYVYPNGEHYFRIKSPNGRILCHSEGYHNKKDCLKAVSRIMKCREWVIKDD